MNPHPTSAGRDPVCVCIERLLLDLKAQGKGTLETSTQGKEVRVTFDRYSGESFTYDVALIRLANAMMDDPRYSEPLKEALREAMRQTMLGPSS